MIVSKREKRRITFQDDGAKNELVSKKQKQTAERAEKQEEGGVEEYPLTITGPSLPDHADLSRGMMLPWILDFDAVAQYNAICS